MRKMTITFLITLALMIGSCGKQRADFGNQENPLFGKIFQDIEEISELYQWQHLCWSVIYAERNRDGSHRFMIEHFKDENDNHIFVFVALSLSRNGSKIIDTINIGKLKDNESVEFLLCDLMGMREVCDVIAVFIWKEDMDGYEPFGEDGAELVRAWRANTNTGRFEIIDIE